MGFGYVVLSYQLWNYKTKLYGLKKTARTLSSTVSFGLCQKNIGIRFLIILITIII